ncbi:non-specific lipid transfer protein GPI-anchored 15-like [Andrographis paniculata]|uniref:non-specific lipid transfer protein GPI-anchored 15-like n=1 Tax=Andrographis paniculata TaxID=175694 RepID=UPI0021E95529|nr:non-specific lipid transfer protein GPI-anchored 15-like [Andrographis paniculata]
MATEKFALIMVVALTAGVSVVAAQSRCSTKVLGLSSCLTYITRNSSSPSPSCCASLDSLVRSQPECLCPLLSNGAGFSLGVAINRTLATALPAACNLKNTQISQCNELATGPAAAPLPPSPEYAFPETPAATNPPSGLSSDPDTDENTSRGSRTTMPFYPGLIAVIAAAVSTLISC